MDIMATLAKALLTMMGLLMIYLKSKIQKMTQRKKVIIRERMKKKTKCLFMIYIVRESMAIEENHMMAT